MGRSGRRSIWTSLGNAPRQSQGGVWDRTVAAAKILTGPATARVESLRRVCHIRMGQAPDTPCRGTSPSAIGCGSSAHGSGTSSRSGLSQIQIVCNFGPHVGSRGQPRSWTRIIVQSSGAFQRDSDISPDQLAAVAQVIKTGAVPFADFISLFVPRPASPQVPDLKFAAYNLSTATGEWQKKEQPAPQITVRLPHLVSVL